MLAKGVAWHVTGYLALFGWETVHQERREEESRKRRKATICEQWGWGRGGEEKAII